MSSLNLENDTAKNIHDSRLDMSGWLLHFTKGASGKCTLETILKQKKIISNKGVISFTESPLNLYIKSFDFFKPPNPLYAPYGIAIKKSALYDIGARPALYMTSKNEKYLRKKIKWRYVELDCPKLDFTWQREWRLRLKKLKLNKTDVFIIIDSKADEKSLAYKKKKRIWKSITFDKVKTMDSKHEIEKYINKQILS